MSTGLAAPFLSGDAGDVAGLSASTFASLVESFEAGDDLDDDQVSEIISRCRSDLKQKDELIGALIHELEQAVEQLDRIERTGPEGSNAGQSFVVGNAAFEQVDSKSPLMDDLRLMVDEWGQSQPGNALLRIESQLADVYDLVRALQNGEHPRVEAFDTGDRLQKLNRVSEPVSQCEADTVDATLDETSPKWEAIKNQIFAGENYLQHQTFEASAEDSELLRRVSETPTPAAVDFVVADVDELKNAIIERDAYIILLNRLFRTRNTLSLPVDWAILANVPGETQIRVESLIEHLDVQVRLGEVEMSLERARLARERSQIQSEREHLEKHLRRLGLTSIADLDNISAATGTSGDRRWMRFLGPNSSTR